MIYANKCNFFFPQLIRSFMYNLSVVVAFQMLLGGIVYSNLIA